MRVPGAGAVEGRGDSSLAGETRGHDRNWRNANRKGSARAKGRSGEAYYGVQTARALENFQISGIPINHYPGFVEAWAIVKLATARANTEFISSATFARNDELIVVIALEHRLRRLLDGGERLLVHRPDLVKMGRAEMQDAVPMTVGQEFHAFAASLESEIDLLREAEKHLYAVNMGRRPSEPASNVPKGYAQKCAAHLASLTGKPIVPASDMIAATWDQQGFVDYSGALKMALARSIDSDWWDTRSSSRAVFSCGFKELKSRRAGSRSAPPTPPRARSSAAPCRRRDVPGSARW